MSQTTNIPEFILSYPMGPALRKWIGIPDSSYKGTDAGIPTGDQEAAMGTWLQHFASESPLQSPTQFTDIIEELVGMHLAVPALQLIGYFPDLVDADDFRTQFQVGNAAMIGGDLSLAEAAFERAQHLLPEETAPYINLAQIYFHDHRDADAKTWCLAGLEVDKNNFKLWETLAAILGAEVGADSLGKEILALAEKKSSWAGLSLGAEIVSPDVPEVKLGYLESLYHQGLRETNFLIELTAVMGAAGHLDRIPPVVWQADKLGGGALPWQLWIHAAQAQLGLGKNDLCREYLEKVRRYPQLPDSVPAILDQLQQEASDSAPSHSH